MQSYVRASNRPQDKGKKRKHDYSDEHYDSNGKFIFVSLGTYIPFFF